MASEGMPALDRDTLFRKLRAKPENKVCCFQQILQLTQMVLPSEAYCRWPQSLLRSRSYSGNAKSVLSQLSNLAASAPSALLPSKDAIWLAIDCGTWFNKLCGWPAGLL